MMALTQPGSDHCELLCDGYNLVGGNVVQGPDNATGECDREVSHFLLTIQAEMCPLKVLREIRCLAADLLVLLHARRFDLNFCTETCAV